MRRVLPRMACGIAAIALAATATVPASSQRPAQPLTMQQALGKWRSTERFEDEPRITVSIKAGERSVDGWAVLLGQHRKTDDRATLALSFTDVTWTGDRFRFSTHLPEDEGTIGWELRITAPTAALLVAMTEDGQPMQEELKWDMTR